MKKLPNIRVSVMGLVSMLTFAVFPANALAATLSLSPSSGTFNRGCPVILDINVDTGGEDTDGTDAILIYDNSRLTANSSAINTELNPKIYTDFPGNNVDDSAGKITISGLASVASAFKGSGTLAKVTFTVKDTAPTGATVVKFDFDNNDKTKTTDSNVVKRGDVVDILSSVTNGNYTIGTGSCSGATPTPTPQQVTVLPATGGQGTVYVQATPVAQIPYKTLDQAVDRTGEGPGTKELTYTVVIVGITLTVMGILGLALL